MNSLRIDVCMCVVCMHNSALNLYSYSHSSSLPLPLPLPLSPSLSPSLILIHTQHNLVVEALYDCDPDHQDELGFKEGDKIVVTKKLNKDWWVSH